MVSIHHSSFAPACALATGQLFLRHAQDAGMCNRRTCHHCLRKRACMRRLSETKHGIRWTSESRKRAHAHCHCYKPF